MDIKGFIGVSLVDWDTRISSVIFLPCCNMRCPFCYNTNLVLNSEEMQTIHFEEIQNYLKKHEGWIEGVVMTGGEPTIQGDLPILCKKIKKMNLAVKVDTNGTNPNMIQTLIKKGLVNYVAMDVKAPFTEESYSKACGVKTANLLKSINKSIATLLESGIEYEFRTTLVPTIHGRREIENICEKIKGCRKYALQNFKTDVKTIDSKFQNLKPFSNAELEKLLKIARNIIPNTILRD